MPQQYPHTKQPSTRPCPRG